MGRSNGAFRAAAMLYGAVGATFFSVSAYATDPVPYLTTTTAPAVDGLNGKAETFGGVISNRSVSGQQGSFSVPLASSLGLQIDGAFGSFDNRGFGNVAGHLFWRDPGRGLIGIYTSHTVWDQFGGVYVGQVAGEAEYYAGRFTVQGIAGVEFGNAASRSVTTISTVAPAGFVPGVVTTSTLTTMFDVRTRFFDQINLKYYFTDNWDGYVGHRYLGGKNALALGSEYAFPLGSRFEASIFIEARAGESNFNGVWGGVKFYFGQKDKPLIARQRQDDPTNWSIDSLSTIVNSQSGSGSSSSSQFCTPPSSLFGGVCANLFN